MRKRKDDLEKESNNLSIIVVLSLFLICSLGYIAYDKYFSNILGTGEFINNCIPAKEVVKKVEYNKDGYFIQSLMEKILYKSYINHSEYQLYVKDKVTLEDLDEYYRNNLITKGIVRNDSISVEDFNRSSIEKFGKKVYDTMPEKISVFCSEYGLNVNGSAYNRLPAVGGCGGAGYRYYDQITKVDSDEDHIYVFQKVGFSCDKGICKNVEKTETGYTGKDVIKEMSDPMESVNMDDLVKELNEYKFTFTYDTNNNIYYFESVEKVTE